MMLPWLLAVELALYASCFVCGIVTAAALTITQGSLGGHCMLYGTVEYNTTARAIEARLSSPVSLCYFVSAVSVLVAVICFSLSLYWLYACCIDGEVRRENLGMTLTLVVCGVFLFFLLVSGCILKMGRDSLCISIIKAVGNITSCEQAQDHTWAAPLDGHQFYSRLHKAETAVWVNFFFWIIVGGLVLFQRRRGSAFTMVDGFGGRAGAESPGETEPFFNHPARTH